MSFLGVLAGFMTHEHESILWDLERAAKDIKKYSKKDAKVLEALENINNCISRISGYVDYTRLYIKNINKPVRLDVKAKPRIRHVVNIFKQITDEKDIDVIIKCDVNQLMSAIPIPMYEGLILNLFSNAVKALIAANNVENPSILIVVWSDSNNRYLSISDNGSGIPKSVESRIWDPLYTTTSGESNPLGSGMGLGLPLIKRVVESINGKVETCEPPVGYETSFKIKIPRNTNYGKN